MSKGNSIVAVYPSHLAAEAAIKELQQAGFEMTKLSIIGKDYHTAEKVVGYYTTGERMKYWGVRAAFWGGIWGALFGAGFFLVPGVGSVLVAGPLLGAVVGGLESAAMAGGLSATAVRLILLGVPREEAINYESAIFADKFLLIANGTPEELSQARLILGIPSAG